MRQHGYRINKATVRSQLSPRDEPYWFSLGAGRAIGFRRSRVREGTWYARWTEPQGDLSTARPKYLMKSLGSEAALEFGQAVNSAHEYFHECELEWTRQQHGPVAQKMESVQDACRAYITSLREKKGEEPALRAQRLLERVVYGNSIAAIPLRALTKSHIETWRNKLVREPTAEKRGRSKRAVNRLYRQLAAALSYAKACGAIGSDLPWKQVGLFPVQDGRRPAYLTSIQRRAVIDACEREKPFPAPASPKDRKELLYCNRDLADFLRALFFTGARPGEIAKVRVRDLCLRESRLTLVSAKNKKGEARPRDFFLYEPEAFEFFQRMAGEKSPDDYLITRAGGGSWVNEKGAPNYMRWGRGIRAAVREANKLLGSADRIQAGTVAYTARHTVITDMLSTDGIDQPSVSEVTGTSAQMIAKHYFKLAGERMKDKLSRRKSI